MKILNKSGIPDIIHQYLTHDNYDYVAKGNSYSATELLKPIQEILLTRRYGDKIEVDSADRIWALFGSAVHSVLENGSLSEHQEERLKTEIDGITISGKFDLVKDNKLYDFKCTSVWTIVYNSRIEEWTKQLSIYRWLYYRNHKDIELEDTAFIIAILRDWANKDKDGNNYPKSPIVEIPIKLMSYKDTFEMVDEKIKDLLVASQLLDNDLPNCSKEDRWYNAKKKVFNKCEKYCQAYRFCKQIEKEKDNDRKEA